MVHSINETGSNPFVYYGDFNYTLDQYKRWAQEGNIIAQIYVASVYRDGKDKYGISKDPFLAFYYFKLLIF